MVACFAWVVGRAFAWFAFCLANASRWHEERRMRISSTTENVIRTRGGNFEALALGMCRPKRFTDKVV
ncbi:hypothetical protein HPB47_015322 [Ixodes persulcatus]|uniref:Uncharacterized protein n=1 Tax=Ixodes persulcatus TaxID=34615 RepID=A0AC60QWB2_IXOPE|nr:hypothetical protein HPB47_015322 [Ixodes persulcatus]